MIYSNEILLQIGLTKRDAEIFGETSYHLSGVYQLVTRNLQGFRN
jgi:hypothetical protein